MIKDRPPFFTPWSDFVPDKRNRDKRFRQVKMKVHFIRAKQKVQKNQKGEKKMGFLAELDGNVLLWLQEYIRQEWMHGFWKAVTSLGDSGIFWIALSLLLLIPKPTRRIGITALAALAIGALITNVVLKHIIARTRPYEVIDGLILLIEKQSDFSFPSGHTCASFAAAGVYWRMMPKKYGIPLLILAVLIAFSRLYVGVHYPSDVLGGLLAGLFAAWAAWHIQKILAERKQVSQKPDQEE